MERPRPPAAATATTTGAASQFPALPTSSNPSDPLRTPLDLRRATWALQQAAASAGNRRDDGVMRVNQVDVSVLDGELLDLLRIQLAGILVPPFFPPGAMDRCVRRMIGGEGMGTW